MPIGTLKAAQLSCKSILYIISWYVTVICLRQFNPLSREQSPVECSSCSSPHGTEQPVRWCGAGIGHDGTAAEKAASCWPRQPAVITAQLQSQPKTRVACKTRKGERVRFLATQVMIPKPHEVVGSPRMDAKYVSFPVKALMTPDDWLGRWLAGWLAG